MLTCDRHDGIVPFEVRCLSEFGFVDPNAVEGGIGAVDKDLGGVSFDSQHIGHFGCSQHGERGCGLIPPLHDDVLLMDHLGQDGPKRTRIIGDDGFDDHRVLDLGVSNQGIEFVGPGVCGREHDARRYVHVRGLYRAGLP